MAAAESQRRAVLESNIRSYQHYERQHNHALALFVAAKYAATYYPLFGLIFFVVVGWLIQKHRSVVGWFLLSIVITPLFALITLVAVPRKLLARELRGSDFDGGALRITREYFPRQ